MKTNLEETKKIFKMALEGKTFKEISETPEYAFLEMVMGIYILDWYEMYVEYSTKEELEKYYNLPLYERKTQNLEKIFKK